MSFLVLIHLFLFLYSHKTFVYPGVNHLPILETLLVGPAKVNKVKIFSEPCYIIECVLTFVSGVQESVLVNFINQNKVKILHKVKICQNCLYQKFPYKNEQIYIF